MLSVRAATSAGFVALALSPALGRAQDTPPRAPVGAPTGNPAAGAPEPFTASPVFGPDGTLWLVRAMADRIVVSRSSDLGKSFSAPVVVTPEPMNLDWGPDARARIAVDPKGGLIVTFAIFQDKNFNGRAFFVRSNDRGTSFTPPIATARSRCCQASPISRPSEPGSNPRARPVNKESHR